jgi:hypothetical protein
MCTRKERKIKIGPLVLLCYSRLYNPNEIIFNAKPWTKISVVIFLIFCVYFVLLTDEVCVFGGGEFTPLR